MFVFVEVADAPVLTVVFPADTVKYLPQKSEIEKHCIFYLNKMIFMTFTMTLTVTGVSVIG